MGRRSPGCYLEVVHFVICSSCILDWLLPSSNQNAAALGLTWRQANIKQRLSDSNFNYDTLKYCKWLETPIFALIFWTSAPAWKTLLWEEEKVCHIYNSYWLTLNTWNASNWMLGLLSRSKFIMSFRFSGLLMYLVMMAKLCRSRISSPRSCKQN